MENDKNFNLSPLQIARLAGVSASTLRRWENDGLLHSKKDELGRRFFSKEQLPEIKKLHEDYALKKSDYGKKQTKHGTRVIPGLAAPSRSFSVGGTRNQKSIPILNQVQDDGGVGFNPKQEMGSDPISRSKIAPLLTLLILSSILLTSVLATKPGILGTKTNNKNKETSYAQKSADALKKSFSSSKVLAESDIRDNISLSINVPAQFKKGIKALGQVIDAGSGTVIASNLIYSITAGDGIEVTEGQDPTISNTGVLSFMGSTGDLTLEVGEGLEIDSLELNLSGDVSLLGQTIETAEITDGTVGSADLNSSNVASSGYFLSANDTGGFTWLNQSQFGLQGSGAAGYITMWQNANTLTYDTDGFFWDSTNNRLGIGTTSPSYTLDVSGSSRITGDLRLTGAFYDTSNTAGSSGYLLTSTGTGTAWSSSISGGLIVADSLNWTEFIDAMTLDATTTIDMDTNSADFNFDNGTLYIDNAGKVGVGTTSPTYLLSVGSSSQFGVDSSGYALHPDGAVGTPAISFTGDTDTGLYRIGANTLGFAAGGVNKFTLDSDGIGIGTTNPSVDWELVSSDTTNNVALFTADSLTTGTGLTYSFDALTTGTGVSLTSTSTALSTGKLLSLDWSPTGSTEIYSTGDLFKINIGTYGNVGNLFALYDDGSELFSVDQSKITSALPHEFTAAGDVSMAYDLIMTNQSSSNIKSYGPLTIDNGESWESNNLTLRTYNAGNILLDLLGTGYLGIGASDPSVIFDVATGTDTDFYAGVLSDNDSTDDDLFMIGDGTTLGTNPFLTINTSGNVGIGTTSPTYKLDVNGTLGVGSTAYFASLVGIGTTVPLQKLQVEYTGSSYGLLVKRAESGSAGQLNTILFGNSANSGGNYDAYIGVSRVDTLLSDVVFGTNGSSRLTDTITERMRITNAGNVGVGTTSPTSMLSVGASSQFQVNSSGNIVKLNNVTTSFPSSQGSAGTILTNDGSGNLTWVGGSGTGSAGFWTRTGTTLTPYTATDTIATLGSVGIGTTAPTVDWELVSSDTTNNVALFTADSLTTGTGLTYSFDALTTGTGISLTSTSTALSTGKLLSLDWSPTGSTEIYSTGDLFKINIGTYGNIGNLFALYDDGSELFSVDQSKITSALPHEFTAAGDVSMAYDLQFTNVSSSNIKSDGPLTISSGEVWGSQNLTLKTYNQGAVLVDYANSDTTANTHTAFQVSPVVSGAITTGTRTVYGIYNNPTSTAASSGGTLNLYGSYNVPSSTLATAGATNVYGSYISGTATHAADAGTVNQYGLYIANGTSSTNGTSAKYGLYVEAPTGADTNYAAIFAGGNIGIGTTLPTQQLTVSANTVLGSSTSATETLANTGFVMGGDDLFVAGMAGFEGNLYTDGSFIAGASTTYGNGSISQTSGETLSIGTTAANLTLSNTTSGNILLSSPGFVGIGGTAPSTAASLYIGSTGNVGIGTTAPTALLHLGIGSTATVGQNIVLASGATANAFEVNSSSGVGGDKFVIKADGNVGIGTTSPTNSLEVFKVISGISDLIKVNGYRAPSSNVGPAILFTGSSNAVEMGRIASVWNDTSNADTSLRFYTRNSGLNEKMRLSSTGGLSLGTSYLGTDPGAGSMIISGNVGIGTTAPIGPLQVNASATPAFVVTSAGLIGIGTTSPGAKTEIAINTSSTTNVLRLTNAGDNINTGVGLEFYNAIGQAGQVAQIYTGVGNGYTNNFLTIQVQHSGEAVWTFNKDGNITFSNINNNKSIGLDRQFYAGTPGRNFTVYAGGTAVSQTNQNGGNLFLASGLSTGTGGSNIYFQTSGNGTSGTSDNVLATAMAITATGNVGIGTTAPTYKLDVNGTLGVGSTAYFASNVGIGTTAPLSKLGLLGNASIGATYGGIAAPVSGMIIEGNVGIGTTGPGYSLDVSGTGRYTGSLIANDSRTNAVGLIVRASAWTNTQNIQQWYDHNNVLTAYMSSAGQLNVTAGSGQGVAVGDLLIQGQDSRGVYMRNSHPLALASSGANPVDINAGNGDGTGGLRVGLGNGSIALTVAATSGNVGIGTTAPTALLHLGIGSTATVGQKIVLASGATANAFEVNSSSGVGGDLFVIKSDGKVGIGTTAPGLALDVIGSARFSAVGSGAAANDLRITADGTLTTDTSDISMKTNILPMSGVLDKLLQLNPVTFNWNSDPTGKTELGLIAQEVASVFPEATFTNPTDGLMGINYSRLSPLLLAGLQELQLQVNSNNSNTASTTNETNLTNKLSELENSLLLLQNSEQVKTIETEDSVLSLLVSSNDLDSDLSNLSNLSNNTNLLGIVTKEEGTNPKTITIKTRGKATVKVTSENGDIKKGDPIGVSLVTDGLGAKLLNEGMIVGYALEDTTFNDSSTVTALEIPEASGSAEGSVPEASSSTTPNTPNLPNDLVTQSISIFVSVLYYKPGSTLADQMYSDPVAVSPDNQLALNPVLDTLNVLGASTFNNVTVTGNLSFGLLTVNGAQSSISTVVDELKLQTSPLAGNVNIFNGKIVLTNDGNITILKTLTADKIKTNTVEVSKGITLKDQVTGVDYCVTIANGEMVKTLGKCE